jgi:hypothetical protein
MCGDDEVRCDQRSRAEIGSLASVRDNGHDARIASIHGSARDGICPHALRRAWRLTASDPENHGKSQHRHAPDDAIPPWARANGRQSLHKKLLVSADERVDNRTSFGQGDDRVAAVEPWLRS